MYHGGCVVLSRVVCDLLVGRKASSCYSSSVPSPTSSCVNCLGVVCSPLLLVCVCVWFVVEDQVAGCLSFGMIRWPACCEGTGTLCIERTEPQRKGGRFVCH